MRTIPAITHPVVKLKRYDFQDRPVGRQATWGDQYEGDDDVIRML